MRRMLLVILVACGPQTPPGPGPSAGGGGPPGAGLPPPTTTTTATPTTTAPPARRDDPPADDEHPLAALHNQYRAAHCAPPLEWSDKLAKVAQKWADQLRDDGCKFGHSRTSYGENLAAGTSSALDDATVVDMWYREVDQYDFKRAGFDASTGHFTQLVWVGTSRVGCGRSQCKGNDIVVCNYDPPGNVMTAFEANVLPSSCKKRSR